MIEVRKQREGVFEVTVREGGGETHHRVTMSAQIYANLSGGRVSEERLLEAAFRFLLERESKEQILRQFDVTVIARYFPEFETALPRYLKSG